MIEKTQLAVIGAGPGGYTAAFLAADLGLRVTLIDEAPRPGGVCLYRGCMPSKALLHAAKVMTDARAAAAWGVSFGEPIIDVARLRGWKDEVVARLTGGLALLSKQRDVTFAQGRASFEDAHTLRVAPTGDGAGDAARTIAFEHAVLATGSRPARPAVLALDDPRVLDSTRALDIEQVTGVAARDRRRLHRTGARDRLRRSRNRRHDRRDGRQSPAGRRRGPGAGYWRGGSRRPFVPCIRARR